MLRIPIVTMLREYHAPEFDYLRNSSACLAVSGTSRNFIDAVIELLNNPGKIQLMRETCEAEREGYTLEIMVDNFMDGIGSILVESDS